MHPMKGSVTYHPSCHLLRELKVRTEPPQLLSNVKGIEIKDLPDAEQCCGFGGSFAVKYPHISGSILQRKLDCIRKSGADTLVANDAGCLMQMAGGLKRQNVPVQARHIAEILASRQ